MSNYINHLDISPSNYADNIEKAVVFIGKTANKKSDYEKEVEMFYNKAVEMHKVNRLRCQEASIKAHEKKCRQKANFKIRAIIQVAEKELFKLEKNRKLDSLNAACAKFNVNHKTIKRLL